MGAFAYSGKWVLGLSRVLGYAESETRVVCGERNILGVRKFSRLVSGRGHHNREHMKPIMEGAMRQGCGRVSVWMRGKADQKEEKCSRESDYIGSV